MFKTSLSNNRTKKADESLSPLKIKQWSTVRVNKIQFTQSYAASCDSEQLAKVAKSH
jgi:hypothetical protein